MRGGIWIPIFILALNIVLAQNLGFEDGLTFWNLSYASGGQNYLSSVSTAWGTEGNASLFFAGSNNGMFSNNGHRSSIVHTLIQVTQGEQVCLDLRKENGPNSYRLESNTIGIFLPGIQSRVYNTTCKISDTSGPLDLSLVGTSSSGCSGDCLARVYVDNIRILSCSDGIQNQNETDIDCGGPFCGKCDLGLQCVKHVDCVTLHCSENGLCEEAPSFSHLFNFIFETGTNDYWKYNYTSGGQDYSSSVNQFWRSEGNYSLALPRITSGIHTLNGHSSTFFHNETILEAGDEVCFNMKKNSTSLSKWRVDLVSGGEIFTSVPSGEYIHVCENSTGNGSLGIKVTGTETFSCSLGAQCFARFFFDNITVNANKCNNLVLDHFETDLDCGGFCAKCSLGKACLYDFDCENNECLDGFCGGFVSEEESLLEKYAPVLYFHPDEQFFPMTIEAMLNESDLIWNEALLISSPIKIEDLSNSNESIFLDLINASGGLGLIGEIPIGGRFTKYGANIYGREFIASPDIIILQYWFFYPYNDWINNHEGDWEMIQIFLDSPNNSPIEISYSSHYGGLTLPWENASVMNLTHPEVFVTVGGHGSWNTPGNHRWFVNQNQFFPGCSRYTDETTDTGIVLEPVNYNLYNLNNETWINFLGLWGTNGTKGTSGPKTPPFIQYEDAPNRWNNPIEWANNPNPTSYTVCTGSPVDLHAYDSNGNHVGQENGNTSANIQGTYLYLPSDNESELLVILGASNVTFVVNGTGKGAFNLSIGFYDRESQSQISITYNDTPVNESTTAWVNITPTNPNFVMKIDEDADGIIDKTILPTSLNAENNPNNEIDSDNDGFSNSIDNCPELHNSNQETDFDLDGFDNLLCGGNDCDDSDSSLNPNSNETCNNIDDNCNNKIDENITRNCGLTNVGICSFGEEYCISGNWQNCNAIFPESELCNNLDDDCNSNIDDGFNLSEACFLGIGECKAEGLFVCSVDNQSSICNAIPKNPSTELCDEKDNDCDGIVDNNCAVNNKLQAITILENEKTGSCPSRGICKDNIIDEMIGDIEKSLNPIYFINNETLGELGSNVFKYESHAALLCDRSEEKIGMEEACLEAVNLMKAADNRFAQNALNFAKSLVIQNSRNQKCYDKKIGTAELYIRNAEDFFTKYYPNKVIDRYGLAWKNAMGAVKFADAVKDIC